MRAHNVLVFLLYFSRAFVNIRVYKNPSKLVLQNACKNNDCINSCDCSCECSSECCDDQINNDYEYAKEYYQYLNEYNKSEDTEVNFLKSNKDDSKINYVEFAKKRKDKYKTFETNFKLILVQLAGAYGKQIMVGKLGTTYRMDILVDLLVLLQ